MSKFEELKRKVIEQCDDYEVDDGRIEFKIRGVKYSCTEKDSVAFMDWLLSAFISDEQQGEAKNISRFEELKRKARDQIFCGVAKGEVEDERVKITIDGVTYYRYLGTDEKLIDELIKKLDKNWEEKHSTANRNAKPKAIFEYRVHDEVEELIEDRGSESYSDISDTASAIIKALGTDSEYTYFFSQIANKLARVKNGYSVEDSLLDIAGYAKLELDKFRGKNES